MNTRPASLPCALSRGNPMAMSIAPSPSTSPQAHRTSERPESPGKAGQAAASHATESITRPATVRAWAGSSARLFFGLHGLHLDAHPWQPVAEVPAGRIDVAFLADLPAI